MRKIDKLMKRAASSERLIYTLRTVIMVAISTFICLLLNQAGVMKENVLMVFLIGVLLIGAFTAGYEYGIFGAVVSVLLFNYFFHCPGTYVCDHESGRRGADGFISGCVLHFIRHDGKIPEAAFHCGRE